MANKIKRGKKTGKSTRTARAAKKPDSKRKHGRAGGAAKFTVAGTVRDASGAPVSGAIVVAFDKDLRSEQILGEARTSDDGRFSIAYSQEQFSRAEKGSADLRVAVLDKKQRQIATSAIRFNAAAEETFDLDIEANAPSYVSEYERLVAELTPPLQDVPLAQLTEDDIAFLAGDTGQDRQQISWLSIAARHSQETAGSSSPRVEAAQTRRSSSFAATVPAEAFYAWFRLGLSTELAALWSIGTDELIATLKIAIERNIVPRQLDAWLDKLPKIIDSLKVDRLLQPATPGQPASLGDLLATMPGCLTPTKERIVAEALRDPSLTDDAFVRQLRKAKFKNDEIAAVQVTRALGTLTSGHTALVQDLQNLRHDSEDPSLRFLASVPPVRWLELAHTHQANSPPGTSPEIYAEHLERTVEARHPTAVLAARIQTGHVELHDSALKEAAAVLAANPQIELNQGNARTLVNALGNVKNKEALIGNLQRIQRAQNLGANWRETGVLLNGGLGAALNIVQYGLSAFQELVAGSISAERANSIFAEAKRVHDTTVALVANTYVALPVYTLGIFLGERNRDDTANADDYPSLRELFGNLTTCECDHCQSVLSPAAYLVDLLRFLDPQSESVRTGPPALSTLLARRPDIADLELTCKNTRTEIPYVDLVLEVLENGIGLPIEIPAPYGFDPQVDLALAPVPSRVTTALRAVLERSAISVGDRLQIQKSARQLLIGTLVDWMITDGARHWTLRHFPQSLTAWRFNAIAVPVQVADYTAARASLDQGLLPTIDWVIPPNGGERAANLPLKANATVTQVEAGKRWRVSYTRAARVSFVMAAPVGAIILKTADGQQQLSAGQYPTGMLQRAFFGLQAGDVVEPLLSLLPEGLQYQITAVGTEWEISTTAEITLIYTAERLQIASLTYQTSDSREDLLASSENRNPAAYEKLDGAVFPWTLPFNLWLEEVRVFLERRGVSRRRLMEECNPSGRLADAAIAREVLGLSLSESSIITASSARPQWEYWGLQQSGNRVVDRNDERLVVSGSWSDVLSANVSILLQQSGLSYRELLNALQTRFVRAQAPVLKPLGDECNPSKMKLTGLQPAHLDRIHRLVRLWRKRGGSVFELDLAIAASAVDPASLNESTLVRLANLQRLHELLSLSISEIAAWWGAFTTGYYDYTSTKRPIVKSVYERLFLNPTITNPPDRAFALNEQRTELVYETPAAPPTLASKAAVIAAALGITQSDLDELIEDLTSRQELDDPATLKLGNLSALFRNVSIARALRLSIPAYLRMKERVGIDPFASPANAILFAESVQFVARSGFAIDALQYLLQYTLDEEPSSFMTMDWASSTLADMRGALQTVQNALLGSADSFAASLRKMLAGIGWYEELVEEAVELFASSGQLEVQVPGALAVTIPAALANRVTYRIGSGTMIGSPALTAAQWSNLDAANASATVKTAIAALRTKVTAFSTALPERARRMQSFELPAFSIAYSPQSQPAIPRALASRCYFDAASRRIVFTGWMTDEQQAQLVEIVPVAIAADLKTQSDQYTEASALNSFLADAADVRALFAVEQTPDTRVQEVLRRLLPYLYRQAAVERLGAAVDLDPALVADLLVNRLDRAATLDAFLAPEYLDSDPRVTITANAFADQFRALCKVHKAALVYRTLKISLAETQWLPPATSQARVFSVLDLDTFPSAAGDAAASYEEWQRLVQLFQLRDRAHIGSGLLSRLQRSINFDPATLVVAQADLAAQLAYLAARLDTPLEDVSWAAQTQLNLQWPADYQSTARISALTELLARMRIAKALQVSVPDVAAALSQLNHAWPADLQNPARLAELLQLLLTVQRLGAKASESFSLAQDAVATTGSPAKPGKAEAVLARKLLRARYDEQSWPQQLKPIADALRHKQRDALVAYLIARPPQNAVNDALWKDAGDVYEHFLIDPQMSSCKVSTRILHAISAVQLFVQRCSMNLEQEVSPAAIDVERWKWMKNYRVWEANRKVFLYPENWIEPELRDDKSELFKELEGQLQQSELDNESAQEILKAYLKQLEDISSLAIVGMYVEKLETDSRAEIRVHTVARTRNRPSRFYYRRWVLSDLVNRWEPWEHVALEGVKSDHILPFVMRGDAYIAWPEITQLGSEPGAADSTAPGAKWRMQMAWIRRTNRGWSDRLMSGEVLEHPWVYGKDENQTFTFRVRSSVSGSTDIDCYGAKREGVLLYEAPVTTDITPQRWFVPIPRTAPWIKIKVSGQVYASYANGTVFRPLSGASVRLYVKLNGTPDDNTAAVNDIKWDRDRDLLIYENREDNSTSSDEYGNFSVDLVLVALMSDGGIFSSDLGYFRPTVMKTNPTFELVVSYGNKPAQSKSFAYKNLASNAASQYFSDERFQQNFIFSIGGVAPGGEADRPVTIVPLKKFRIFTADDAEFQPLTAQLPALPNGVLTYGSGFKVAGANQGSSLQVAGATGIAVAVWTGVPASYSLLPAAPFDTQPAEVCVYRDATNSYWIRRQTAVADPQASQGKFQILVDGHPRASDLRREVSIAGLPALFDLSQQMWEDSTSFDVHTPSAYVDTDSSLTRAAIRFEPDSARSPYASYNTELFFHVPLLIASFLSANQRFADAQQWLHFIFDPTSDEAIAGSKRYWRYLPFRNHSETTPIDELLKLLADPRVPTSNSDKQQVTTQIEAWSKNPFRPHAVARLRPRAYEFAVVFKYLDNLIAWGDSLFRQHTTESINEATQLYILAAKLLGARPQSIPRATEPAPLTYRRANNQWDRFSNAWLELEANLSVGGRGRGASLASHVDTGTASISSIGFMYFCVPRNEKMIEYWDTIENRLFNIRHCRNLDGVEQEVPLFQPPIDPALLVRATAAGLDIGAVLADANTPLPYYRFNLLVQKAADLCNEVKGLGGALLSALEKKDAEQLSLLRSSQELGLLNLVQELRETQIAEANAQIDALRQDEKMATTRFAQYQRLLGKSSAPAPDDFGADIEQTSAVSVAGAGAAGDLSSLGLTKAEQDQIGWSEVALRYGVVAGVHSIVSGILYAFPDVQAGTPFLSQKFGGTNLGSIVNAGAAFWSILERNATHQSSRSAIVGQHQRRQDDWVFQGRLALQEIQQVRKQIIAAQLRVDIATKELANHKRQIKNAEETDRFMREKYTSRDLYQWMTQQLAGVYFRTYQLAYDVAKRAERSFRFELGLEDSKYIQFGYWDSLKKGLLAGERLSHDLKRMDTAYLDQNRREYEITKHISLLSLDPAALISLRETGACEVSIPEVLFDLEYPGHYLRRIKSMSLTIPCVTGPYASVSCTLALLKSSVRQNASIDGAYQLDTQSDSDPRFRETFGQIQSIVTSNAQQDSGLFEPNLRDERYLPFEGAGAVSTWRLSMPAQFRQFDYATVADVILHMRYTARDGGTALKNACVSELSESLNAIKRASNETGLVRLFSLKQEFPSQWHRLTNGATAVGARAEEFALTKRRFPMLFASKDITLTVASVEIYLLPTVDAPDEVTEFPKVFLPKKAPATTAVEAQLTDAASIGRMPAKKLTARYADGSSVVVAEADEGAHWRVEIPAADLADFRRNAADILLVCHYSVR